MSKRQQTVHKSHSKLSGLTFRATGQASGYRTKFEYDELGQVVSGRKYWADGTPVAGQQFDYTFDDIGNRTTTESGGDPQGAGLRLAEYGANFLNQYTNRTVPRALDVVGAAFATNTVSVNGQAAYRHGEYFWKEWSTNNNGVVYAPITVASGAGSQQGHVLLPPATQAFTHDLDGNLTGDGLWAYTWDTENRLVAMESLSGVPDAAKQRLDFGYDHLGRRTQKVVCTWDPFNSTWVPQRTNRFVYDGWNLLAQLDHTNGVVCSFTWGTDLSGSLQGAGGVGGLLALRVHSGTNAGSYFCSYDGNGNLTALVRSTDGTTAARYEYGPFGEVIRATGPMAKGNPIRFSTQYTDDETDLVCYLHRYYSPSTGRWPNHDPINELGFKKLTRHNERFNRKEESNLYRFVANNPLIYYDLSGLRGCGKCGPDVTVAVDNTLKAIGDMFAKNPSAQGDMCDALFNPERANGAWDITDLAAAGMSDNSPFDGHPTTGSGSCKRTVVYHGKCIFAGALNYAAFGKMCQLCNKSLFMAELAVTYRKNWQLGDFSCAAAQAFDATAIGYQNSVPWWATGVPITGSCPDCDTSNSRPISETQLHGQWAGNVF